MQYTKMNHTFFYKITISIIIFILFISCDIEKFIGSNYTASPIPTTAKIYGTVYNNFDNLPVYGAQVMINSQVTFSDSSGNYFLNYYIGPDENRNKPVPICVIAKNYMEYNSTSIIYPENRINLYIDYGAPIIQKVTRVGTVCQSIIFDYQGFSNIDSVFAHIYFSPPNALHPITEMVFPMKSKESDLANTGYFQCYVPNEIDYPVYSIPNLLYKVKVHDKSGFTDTTSYIVTGSDTLLFPIF